MLPYFLSEGYNGFEITFTVVRWVVVIGCLYGLCKQTFRDRN